MTLNLQDRSEITAFACCFAGVIDKSYRTVRYGLVFSYSGEATVKYKGKIYKCVGKSSRDQADVLVADGFVEITEVK